MDDYQTFLESKRKAHVDSGVAAFGITTKTQTTLGV